MNSRVLEHAKNSIRVRRIEQSRQIIPLQLITNQHSKFEYHWNNREHIRFNNPAVNDDAAFIHLLYELMLDRVLRNFPTQIMLSDGRFVTWFTGCQRFLLCLYQLRARLTAIGIQFPETDELIEEMQRIDRRPEESHASADGTLVVEKPLIG